MALHLAALIVLTSLATRDRERGPGYPDLVASPEPDADDLPATWLGTVPEDLLALDPPPAATDLPPADQVNLDPRPAAPVAGLPRERVRPMPDTGPGAGRRLPAAWRPDESTLRARLTDGSDHYQPASQATSHTASSPQAIRQEPKVGIGDSLRNAQPEPTQAAPAADLPTASEDHAEVAPPLASETRVPETVGLQIVRGQGPLDAEQGRRLFDQITPGPLREDVASRAASNETDPGMIDYTTLATRGPEDGLLGNGPAPTPGLSRASTPGNATTTDGWPSPRPAPIGDLGEGTSERQFSREYLEIRRRVARVLRFPKRLALLLEQGEAIVQFMVERDGRVWGDVQLLKSAGFEEFDREALEVVRRAAPFPQLSQRLRVRMRVPFENPIIR